MNIDLQMNCFGDMEDFWNNNKEQNYEICSNYPSSISKQT